MTKELRFRAACERWLSLWPILLLFGAGPVAIYFSGVFQRDALLVGFCAFWLTVAVVLILMRSLCLGWYRLTLGIDRQTRRLFIRERRLRTREYVVDAAQVNSVKLVAPVPSAGRVHLELGLQGKESPLKFGWELGREGNGRVFALLQRLWKLAPTEANYFVLRRGPVSSASSMIAGESQP